MKKEIQFTQILLNGRNRTNYNTIARMVVAIYEKRCGNYGYLCILWRSCINPDQDFYDTIDLDLCVNKMKEKIQIHNNRHIEKITKI